MMQMKIKTTNEPLGNKNLKTSRKLLTVMIAFGISCGFLLGPPGCKSPGGLPHPRGLSLASAVNAGNMTP